MKPRTYVAAPPVTPLPYGLLSAAVVLDDLTGTKQLGIQYEPAFCGAAYDANGACQDDPDLGTATVAVDDTALASLAATGAPAGTTYTIEWGDGETTTEADDPTSTHQYAAPGTYTVLVTDDERGYVATATVTVTDGVATGPFDADVAYSRVDTEGIDVVGADGFALYNVFKCAPIGQGGEAAFQERARAALRLGEQRGLERVTGQLLAADARAVDVTPTPGTAVHPVEGLARLQAYATDNYGGVPVIHSGVDTTTVLGRYHGVHRSRTGDRLETLQGALVASGAGYGALAGPRTDLNDPDTAQAAGAGEAWLYATGTVVVHRSDNIEVGPLMSRAPAATNEWAALTERVYTSTWECVVAAVLVDLYGDL